MQKLGSLYPHCKMRILDYMEQTPACVHEILGHQIGQNNVFFLYIVEVMYIFIILIRMCYQLLCLPGTSV